MEIWFIISLARVLVSAIDTFTSCEEFGLRAELKIRKIIFSEGLRDVDPVMDD
jgi:hypothetical protein